MKRLHVLILDPRPDVRSLVKQALVEGKTSAENPWGSVHAVSTVTEAKKRLAGSTRYHAIIVSPSIGDENLASFIDALKGENAPARKSALIALMPQKNAEAGAIAEQLIGGIDGFLVEPFSVESTSEVARIALGVATAGDAQRTVAAAPVVATSMLRTIDQHAAARARGGAEKPLADSIRPGVLEILRGFSDTVKNHFLQTVFTESQFAQPNLQSKPRDPAATDKTDSEKRDKKDGDITVIHR